MALLLVLLAAFPPMPAEAAGPALQPARWLGPTGMLEGWHVRLAFAVTNPLDVDILDATVGADVPLGGALLEAGWASSRKGGAARPESFELDPLSIRVVEYRNLLEGASSAPLLLGEAPSRASMGLLATGRPFDNRTQPDLHVEWVLPGVTPAKATRHFYVYADTKGNGLKPAGGYAEAQAAPLEGRYWTSRGTTLYGVANRLTLVGLEPDTLARVDTYQGGKPYPLDVGPGATVQNPARLTRNEVARLDLGDEPQVVRVVSNKPVLAMGTGVEPWAYGGVVPSADGGVRGTRFVLPPLGIGYLVLATDGSSVVSADGGPPVTLEPPTALGVQTAVLTNGARPVFHDKPLHTLTADRPVMVLAWPDAPGATQFPSAHGAPVGSRLVGLPYDGFFCGPPASPNGRECRPQQTPPCDSRNLEFLEGQLLVAAYDDRSWVRGRDLLTGAAQYPRAASGEASRLARDVPAGGTWRTSTPAGDCPVELYASPAADDAALLPTARLSAFGGDTGDLVGALGGVSARRFVLPWSAYVVAFHNGTDVEVRVPGGPPVTRGLGASDLLRVDAAPEAPVEVRASKPVAILGISPGAFFAGLDASLVVQRVGRPEYRGYLVSLEPAAGATEPMVGVAAAGKPATYRLVVRNLAKDELGQGVPDVVRLSVDPPAGGWEARLSDERVPLAGGASREVMLTLTPPPDVEEGAPLRLSVHAASEGNPAMSDHVGVVTVVRAAYEVDVWFDREGGPKARTVTVDPAATQKVQVVVKNLAAVPDRVSLTAAALSPDWQARFDETQGTLVEADLAPGESRAFALAITAPAGNASQSVVEVTAASLSDAAATEKVAATVRVRADVRVALEAQDPTVEAPPGGVARFLVTFHNRGADLVSIRFNATGLLPEGWGPVATRQGGYVLDELSGIAPGEALPLEVEVPIPDGAGRDERAGLQFFVETIPQFVGDPVLRESVDLLALAAPRHALVPSGASPLLALEQDGQARARLVVQNEGNGEEELTVVPKDAPRGFSLLLGAPARVPVGERATLPLTLRVAPGAPPGVYPVVAEVRTADGHALPWAFNVTVPERALVRLVPLTPARGIAGLESSARIEILNEGNAPLRLPPSLDVPPGWTPRWEGAEGVLAPGASAIATLWLRAPPEAPSGVADLMPRPDWATGAPLAWDLRTVSLDATAAGADGGVRVLVANGGTGDAFDVDVALVQGERVLDRATLQRVPAGEEAVAILGAAEAGDGPLVVVVDGSGRYAPEPLRLPVDLSPVRETPGPGPVLLVGLLAALACVAAAWRRRPHGPRDHGMG